MTEIPRPPGTPSTETKVTAATVGAGISSVTVVPLVLYLMVRVLGEDPSDPIVAGAAFAIAALLVAGVTWLAGRQRRSRTSAVSDGYDPDLAARLEADRRQGL